MYKQTSAITLLEERAAQHENNRKGKEEDDKYGIPPYADPIFYNKDAHQEIKEALQILKAHKPK